MATTISTQDIVDAKRDIDDIGKAVNENVIVDPRYGDDFKSLPMIAAEAQNTIGEWESAINLITQESGVPALAVSTAGGENQQEINDYNGTKWRSKAGGYSLNARVMLENGDIVKSTVSGNTANPNVDMTGWTNPEADQVAFNRTLPIVIDKVADLATTKNALIGQLVQTRGFYAKSDGGGADYVVSEKGSLIVDGVTIVQLGNSDRVAVMLDLDKKVDIRRFGVKVSSSTVATSALVDQTSAVQLAVTKANNINIPDGRFKVTNSITINKRMTFLGQSMFKTMIYFDPADEFTPLFYLIGGANCGTYADFLVRGNPSTKNGTFVKMSSNVGDSDFVYKNEFRNIAAYELSLLVEFTSSNPLNGTTHAHCDSNLFINGRFSEMKRYVINRNIQAVNNWFICCDFENGNLDDSSYAYIKDEAGSGLHFSGGSIIGKGKLYEWLYPAGGVNLFQGGFTEFKSLRLECRLGYNGVIINEAVSSNVNTAPVLDIVMKDINILNYAAAIDLMRYSGRINATFDNVKTPAYGNSLTIRQYPTIERSSGAIGRGGFGRVDVKDSSVITIRETTSPYGTYNPAYVAPVISDGNKTGSALGLDTDSVGFTVLQSGGNTKFLGAGYNDIGGFGKLVLSSEHPNMPLYGTQKVRLKANTRILKFGFFCPMTSRASSITTALYIVKDNAAWANPSSLNLATDAFKLAELTCPTNETGLYEVPIKTDQVTNLPLISKVGSTGWVEGRIAFTFSADTSGFVYLEYC